MSNKERILISAYFHSPFYSNNMHYAPALMKYKIVISGRKKSMHNTQHTSKI